MWRTLTRKMKDSGVEWIGEIPEDWEVKKIKYMFRIVNGNGFPERLQGEKEGDYPFYKNSDINRSGIYINKSNNYISEKTAIINGFTVIPSNSILIGKIGEALKRNHRKINLSECMIDNNMMALVPKENELFSYYLLSIIDMFWFDNNGTIPSINSNKLRNFKVPYVNKTLQRKIAEILNDKTQKIDKLILSTRQSIEELKKYKQSLITEAVTKGLDPNVEMKDSEIEWIGEIPIHWDVSRPNRVSKIVRGNTVFQKNDMKHEGDFVAVQYGQVYQITEMDKNYNFYVDKSFYKEEQQVENGDTILVSTSETLEDLGHSCFYNRDDFGLLGGEQLILRPNKTVLYDKFLYYASTYFKYELNQYATGLKVFRFKLADLKKINIIIPSSIKEQQQIVSYLDEKTSRIDKLIEDKTKVIEELESYKKSLIYEYVTGKRET